MSIELHIFLEDSRIPSRDEWQVSIEWLAFPTILDPTLDVRTDNGFTPSEFRGKETGFEFYMEPAKDILTNYPHIVEKVDGREQCATFRWSGDLVECGAALSAAAALTKLSDGIYYYPDDDILYNADEALIATIKDLQSI